MTSLLTIKERAALLSGATLQEIGDGRGVTGEYVRQLAAKSGIFMRAVRPRLTVQQHYDRVELERRQRPPEPYGSVWDAAIKHGLSPLREIVLGGTPYNRRTSNFRWTFGGAVVWTVKYASLGCRSQASTIQRFATFQNPARRSVILSVQVPGFDRHDYVLPKSAGLGSHLNRDAEKVYVPLLDVEYRSKRAWKDWEPYRDAWYLIGGVK
jgi:hypothetical protein